MISELELGLEARFLNNRVGLDLSLYNKTSNDLIVNAPLDPSTGYAFIAVNGADVQNQGMELGLDFGIVQTEDLSWTVKYNFTRNVSKVNSVF